MKPTRPKKLPRPAARSRLLAREHFAFYRALLEGVELEKVWDRYLSVEGRHNDLRLVPATVEWIRAELAAAARREERPGTARLLKLDVQRLVRDAPALPSLAQFAEEAGLEDEREADQIEAYEERYGAATARSRRRARLLQRQLAALRWLESVAARDPAPGDAVSAWLRPELARFLGEADVHTLAQLAERINGLGRGWARSIRGIGPLKAERIAQWVVDHAPTIGVAIGGHAARPRRQTPLTQLAELVAPATDIRPLEKLLVPAELDGRAGRFRRPQEQCLLQADNDFDALLAWLRSKRQDGVVVAPAGEGGVDRFAWLGGLSHTQRAYRKEAERFLLWAVMDRRRALSSLDGDDCVAYRDFLANPGSEWVGPRNAPRWSEAWRPFEGALCMRSQATAMTVVRSLCEWLVRRHYLDSNPWDDVPARPDAPSMPQLRALSLKQWSLVQTWIAGELASDPSPALHRLKFILDFAYMTGMRLAELASARLGWLRQEPLDDGELAWSIMVLGKRNKWREVPLPEPAVEALRVSLARRGLDPDPLGNDPATPLISRLGLDAPLSSARIYEILVAAFERCAADVWSRDKRAAERIREASTHWLRHTYGSHAVARGVPPDVLQANLGHESMATTSIYVRAEKSRRHRAMQEAFGGAAQPPATGN